MFEKKLVEKNVEVTVTEKRIIPMYIHNGMEYTKEDLTFHLMGVMADSADNEIEEFATENRCKTSWNKMYEHTNRGFYEKLYNVLDKQMKLIQSLDNDKDWD